jgi:hypothetical protein
MSLLANFANDAINSRGGRNYYVRVRARGTRDSTRMDEFRSGSIDELEGNEDRGRVPTVFVTRGHRVLHRCRQLGCFRWSLERGYYSTNDTLCAQVTDLLTTCQRMGSRIRVIQVPGTLQPADELSRNLPHSQSKILSCLDRMRKESDQFAWLSEARRVTKTKRAADEPGRSLTLERDAHTSTV